MHNHAQLIATNWPHDLLAHSIGLLAVFNLFCPIPN
jgi:hypothetical protein